MNTQRTKLWETLLFAPIAAIAFAIGGTIKVAGTVYEQVTKKKFK